MNSVFMLLHRHGFEPGNKYGVDPEYETIKPLGVYRSRRLAEASANRYRKQVGFDCWPDGFFTEQFDFSAGPDWDGVTVYILVHYYEYGEENFYESFRPLGAYANTGELMAAIEYYYSLPEFSSFSKDCFYTDKYKLDTDTNWLEGFITAEEAEIQDDFD